jgi:hypothetical protein
MRRRRRIHTQATIQAERALGFDHSHNSEVNWERWIDMPQKPAGAEGHTPSAPATAAP